MLNTESILISWEDLPEEMKNDKVKRYYDILDKKRNSLVIKRVFDIVVSLFLIILLLPVFAAIAYMIKKDSKGPVIFRQTRVTAYNRDFTIYKFRTMVNDADSIGSSVTVQGDSRITEVGSKLRKYRLDELPQLVNVLFGDMSFVGTRPEVRKYVDQYSEAMMATLLMPAGITSEASIAYKDEDELLENAFDCDYIYVNKILPEKMKYNLRSIRKFSIERDIMTMIKTVISVI